ncbi:MAG: twin-arginine translocation pathway signal protein [Reyranellaceae bacterium]
MAVPMSRKTFLRVLGGGVVLAAGAAIAAPRLDAMPAEAIEGWRGPPARETDPRRRALAWALLAPNPHNLQSWSVDLAQPDMIRLFVDERRLLPETDPMSRQILIGHGCFLEILSMAAAADGWRTETTLFPMGEWRLDRPVALIRFVRSIGITPEPLFDQVPRRRTVKRAFADRPLEPAHEEALRSGFEPSVARLSIVDEPARVARLRALAVAGSELEMNLPRTHKESIDVVRIGAGAIAAHRDGISLTGPMVWTLRQAGLMTAENALTPGTVAWNGGRDYVLAGYASAQAFGWLATTDNTRSTQIAAGRAFVRLQLAATRLGVALQPHSQTLQEYPEMGELQGAMKRETGVAPGDTLQMFFRLGYAADPGPSPRRPIESFVRA